MSDDFYKSLYEKMLQAISGGKQRFVCWGVDVDCIRLLQNLNEAGLLQFISGVVDSNPSKWGEQIFGREVLSPDKVPELPLDVLVVTSNQHKEEVLREFIKIDIRVPEVIVAGTEHQTFRDPVFHELISSGLVKSYATGNDNSQIHLYQAIKYLADNNIKANVAEFGIFKGGTIAFIARTLKHFGFNDISIYGFDIFEGFPSSKSVLDMYRNPDCEFRDHAAVKNYCEQYGITVIKGDICETYKQIAGVPLMLSFFDTDNYSPTRAALEMCFDQTAKGGILAFDHYFSVERFIDTLGERMAAVEVLNAKNVFNLHGTGIFIKL